MGEAVERFREYERRGWAAADVASAYHEGFGDLTGQSVDALLDGAGVGSGTRVLDVACGPGYVAAAASRRGATAIGIDLSPAQVALARRLHPGLDVREGDGSALPLEDASVDVVLSSFGMPHFPDPDAFLREGFRVMGPGGRIAFVTWAAPPRAIGFQIVLDAISAHGTRDVSLPAGPDFFRFGEPEECRRSLLAAGFERPASSTVEQTWRRSSADELIDAFVAGTVRTGALLRAQPPESLRSIRAAVRGSVRRYTRDGMVELPMPALLTVAERE